MATINTGNGQGCHICWKNIFAGKNIAFRITTLKTGNGQVCHLCWKTVLPKNIKFKWQP